MPQTGETLKETLEDMTANGTPRPTRIFYLATPPTLVAPLASHLNETGLCRDCGGTAWWWKNPSATTWSRPGPSTAS